jgi:predicted GNAT family acetyltransferase
VPVSAIRRLKPADVRAAADLLRRDAILNVYLLTELHRRGAEGGEWWIYTRDQELRGVCLVAGNLVPYAPSRDAVQALADVAVQREGRYHAMLGEKAVVRKLWQAVGATGVVAKELRDNTVYVLRRGELQGMRGARLRPARVDETDEVFEHAVAMYREDIGKDPLAGGAAPFRRRIAARVERRASFLWKERGQLVFKADVGSRTDQVAQIEGVWTPPAFRGRGYATRGMTALCARLLREVPVVTLYVNVANAAARRVYERVGFRRYADYLAVWL